jgi:hypothetical protein
MNLCRLKKQKPGPGRPDLENTSPQAQNTAGLSRFDIEDVSPRAQSTSESYLTKSNRRKIHSKKNKLINQPRKKQRYQPTFDAFKLAICL